MEELDQIVARVRARGPVALPLDGWDRASIWGWDETTGSLYAHLRQNTDDPAKSAAIRIGPDEFTPAITFLETLAQHIAMAVDCNPWRVLTALHDADRQSGEDDDARADEAGNAATLTEGYDIWPVSGPGQDARGPVRGPLNQT